MNMERLNVLLQMTTDQVFDYFQTHHSYDNMVVHPDNDYLYLENKHSPVCLVAHADTVSLGEKVKPIEISGNITNKHIGILGADDRAGVALVLEVLDSGFSPNILITNHEEIGGFGATEFCENNHNLDHIKLFIELDRHGLAEYVNYNPLPDKTHRFLSNIGLIHAIGSFSDIKILTDRTGIPSFNLSCGYYREHTDDEYLSIKDYVLSFQILKSILKSDISDIV